MSMRAVRPGRCVAMNATRVAVARPIRFPKAPVRIARPANLQSEFVTAGGALKGLCATFAGLVLDPVKRAFSGAGRGRLVVQANRKKGLGATLFGTRRKRARVSGFRSRMATVGGRKVLRARRKKGRKNLCPGCRPVRK